MTSTSIPEPIAIIGIGCAFPGARGPEAFWQLLREGRSAIREIPPERFGIDHYHDPTPGTPGKIITRWGGFLEQIDQFDPSFFGISMREAESMDPQQRLLLEVAWEAIEDAGVTRTELSNATTGVFVGVSSSDYSDMQLRQQDSSMLDVYTLPGTARSIVAGRLSHLFDLKGPSIAVDTACSSSLVAAHLACQSLWNGECNLALVGGVNVILTPEAWSVLSLARILSPDGCARVFDARANGFIRGEGAGIALLKPLAQAQADGDPIYAVIRGGAINNDGHNSSVMTPNQQAQEAVLRAAYRHAGIKPGQVHYVEAHGTGTNVGDPIEARALGAVMAGERRLDAPCLIGSVKTNIGHLEAGAGIAGLIKVALCLKQRAIPPSLHFEVPNPAVPWDELPLLVQQEYREWPVTEGIAWAGVSSFGISGTNVHMVLTDRAAAPSSQCQAATEDLNDASFVLPISAHTPAALVETVARYRNLLSDAKDCRSLHDLCYSASVRRTHHAQRLAFVFHSQQELSEQLNAYCQRTSVTPPTVLSRDKYDSPVFVFSGQGAEFWPIDEALLTRFPVFREVLIRCEELLQAQGTEWSLLAELTATSENTRLHETDVCQAAIFACQVALAALWQSWGIVPSAVIGHSLGEVAAAHVAGALSLEQAVTIVLQRGRITKRAAGAGSMALVGLSMTVATAVIQGYGSVLSVAVSNSPTSSVLSGDPVALAEIVEKLEERKIFVRRLPAVDYAAHSPQMEPLKQELAQALQGLTPQSTAIPFYSTVTTTAIAGTALYAHYWADNLREPVRFNQTVQHALSEGHRCFLEVHPAQVLLRPMQEVMDHVGTEAAVYASLRRGNDGPTALFQTLGNLYRDGYAVHWEGLYPTGGRHVRLPTTAWQKRRCWLPGSDRLDNFKSPSVSAGTNRHPLVGMPIQSAAQPDTYFVQVELGPDSPSYLADHRVYKATVLPAAAYVEMALAVAGTIRQAEQHTVTELQLEKTLVFPESSAVPIQIAVTTTKETLSLAYYSCPDGKDGGSWVYHAKAIVQCTSADHSKTAVQQVMPTAFQQAAEATFTGEEHYQMMAAHGLHYGPCFQGIDQLWIDGAGIEVMAKLNLPQPIRAELPHYHLHPVLLDLAFQSVAAVLQSAASAQAIGLYLPVALNALHIHHSPQQAAYAHAVLHPPKDEAQQRLTADAYLLDSEGQILVEAQGLVLQQLTKRQSVEGTDPNQHLYQVTWKKEPLPVSPERAAPGCWLLVGNTDGLGHALAEQLQLAGQACLLMPSLHGEAEHAGCVNPDLTCQLRTALAQTDKPLSGIIYLAALETTVDEAIDSPTEQSALLGLLHLAQLLVQHHGEQHGEGGVPRLWLVTRAAQSVREDESIILSQTPLWGLARTVNLELPRLRCSSIDLQVDSVHKEIALVCQEILADGPETQIAYRGGQRFIARLARYAADHPSRRPRPFVPGEAIRLEAAAPGILDNLLLTATERIMPAPDQVEIRVHSAGLNFLDVLSALGLRPDQAGSDLPLGMECAGTVTRVGENVTDLQIGDAVLAVASHSIGNYTCTAAKLVRLKPTNLSFQEAATVPIAYLTAYYALHTLGRLRAGERVLIHAAAGGVGLAAVYLAQHFGAEIYATAGSAEKRAFLRELGIPYVMDSRSLHFADEVMAQTQGEGVDLVLNSLAGEAIPKSLALLRTNGRFLEIGKRDIYGHSKLDMGLLKLNIAFFAIDLIPLMADQPTFCAEMLAELVTLLASGALPPLPYTEFSLASAEEAFRYMAQAKHIGKIIIRVDDAMAAPLQVASQARGAIRHHGTYLITGGLGGLGLTIAHWLVANGARDLVLLSRREPTPAVAETVATLQAQGANVVTVQADVACADQLKAVIKQIDATMPALRGIFHAAGILDDGLLLDLNPERFARVMAPKVNGGWLLHQMTTHLDLDLFVLFSSATAILGSPGQGNYVAANAFLDGLAHYRHQQGLPALSINWGAWAEVGMATQANRAANLAQQGILPFTPDQGVQLLERILATSAVQVAAVDIDWDRLTHRVTLPFLEGLTAEAKGHNGAPIAEAAGELRRRLQSLTPDECHTAVATLLQEQLSHVLRTPVHSLGLRQPLSELGIDSLMTVELVNRIEAQVGLTLPMAILLENPNIADLTDRICDLLEPASFLTEGQSRLANEQNSVVDKHFIRSVTALADEAVLDPSIQITAAAISRQTSLRQIFLTGATGFVGSFLLYELLQKTEGQIHCLVRAANIDDGRRRIVEALKHSCPDKELALDRIHIVPGDLAQPQLGLPTTEFDRLAEQIDLIIHGGAQIQWLATYAQLKASNVQGTESILRLATHRRPKPLHYVSSLAVFPMMQQGMSPLFAEDSLLDHAGVLYGGYAQSKWVAEKLVTSAQERGLQTMIYRPSLVVGHSQSGIWQGHNIIVNMLRSWIELGMAPDLDAHLDLVPVDYVSRAIVQLALGDRNRAGDNTSSVYHLTGQNTVSVRDLIDWLAASGYHVRRTPYQTWRAEMLKRGDRSRQTILDAVGPLLALQVSTEIGWLERLPRYQNQRTQQALNGFSCPTVNENTFQIYVTQLKQHGVLPSGL